MTHVVQGWKAPPPRQVHPETPVADLPGAHGAPVLGWKWLLQIPHGTIYVEPFMRSFDA